MTKQMTSGTKNVWLLHEATLMPNDPKVVQLQWDAFLFFTALIFERNDRKEYR